MEFQLKGGILRLLFMKQGYVIILLIIRLSNSWLKVIENVREHLPRGCSNGLDSALDIFLDEVFHLLPLLSDKRTVCSAVDESEGWGCIWIYRVHVSTVCVLEWY